MFFNPTKGFEKEGTLSIKLQKDFREFVSSRKFSEADIERAYYILLGVEKDDGTNTKLTKLVLKMKSLEEEGMPVNRFTHGVSLDKPELGRYVPLYSNFVNKMEISENEKSVLLSLLKEDRKGTLNFFFSKETEPFASLKIKEGGSKVSRAKLLLDFYNSLHRSLQYSQKSNKSISITFES